ncbi:MAG: hypothetical protein II208_02085 [Alphaproteobacteria bacterium]|nr:hypothetical protein [Alphaproteobacteria bacterium]
MAFVASEKPIAAIVKSSVLSSVIPESMAFIIAPMVAKPVPQAAKIYAYLDSFACFL